MRDETMLILPLILPLIAGLCLAFLRPNRRVRQRFCLITVLGNGLLIAMIVLLRPQESLTLFLWTSQLSISFHADGFGLLFGALVAILWPLTTIYAFGYMKHEQKEHKFFVFFLCTYGIVMGIAFSGNLLTLYTFYELLTFVTLPLVMHGMDAKARHGGKQYLIYSMLGAALVFAALMIILTFGGSLDFVYGGNLPNPLPPAHQTALLLAFVLAFFGFGVKASLFPFYKWLPGASVAPTPVTALLHGVAVVKSGAFAIGRVIFFLLGPKLLLGTWAQQLALYASAFTILLGALLALRTSHVKRRLAYSTMSQLSYIIFAFSLMTPAGFLAGVLHMVTHAVAKITLFFAAGSVLCQTGYEFVWDFAGLVRRMPLTILCFGICSLSLAGIPPMGGFGSKWMCLTASADAGGAAANVGILALLTSTVLSALYLGDILLKACFPSHEEKAAMSTLPSHPATGCDPERLMMIPLLLLTVLCLALSVGMIPLSHLLSSILL